MELKLQNILTVKKPNPLLIVLNGIEIGVLPVAQYGEASF